MGPAQTGQRRWDVVSTSLGQCALSRLRQRDRISPRLRLAKSPKWRMRTNPFGRTWIKNRRRNSSAEIVMIFLLAAVRIVFPAKRDSIILERHQSMVGDGDAVRIAGEIVQNMFRTSEGWLGVDHPVFAEEESQERVESAGVTQTLGGAMGMGRVVRKKVV